MVSMVTSNRLPQLTFVVKKQQYPKYYRLR